MRTSSFLTLGAAALLAAAPMIAYAAVPTVNPTGLKKQVAARKGKVVLVNMWATWCGPCVKEYPSLVAFSKAQAKKGLELVTVSFDYPKKDDAKVAAFLKKNGQTSGGFINAGGLEPEGYPQLLEPKLPASADYSLPRTYVFDRKGKLVKVLTGEQTTATLQKAVAPYL